ncbi:MAG: hypothetical protein FJY40_12185 [Betaproteobacteria bacterium]|nr:hypothetical protein [Betaproteobacteria bacterium]
MQPKETYLHREKSVKLLASCLLMTVLTLSSFYAAAQSQGNTTRYYDKQGRSTGKSVTQGNTTRYYDKQGRSTGRSVTQGNTTRHMDQQGRTVGRSVTQGNTTRHMNSQGKTTATTRRR